jgi:hypothetical protein
VPDLLAEAVCLENYIVWGFTNKNFHEGETGSKTMSFKQCPLLLVEADLAVAVRVMAAAARATAAATACPRPRARWWSLTLV